jgi:chromosome segregation ATPase
MVIFKLKIDEVNQWKQKYEALAKLYAQLRKEHLDLLNKFKVTKDSATKVSDASKQKVESIAKELAQKASELTDVLVERNRLRTEVDGIKGRYEQEISRLKEELHSTKQSLNELSATQGAEVQNLVARFTAENNTMEALVRQKQEELNIITQQLGDVVSALEKATIVRIHFI